MKLQASFCLEELANWLYHPFRAHFQFPPGNCYVCQLTPWPHFHRESLFFPHTKMCYKALACVELLHSCSLQGFAGCCQTCRHRHAATWAEHENRVGMSDSVAFLRYDHYFLFSNLTQQNTLFLVVLSCYWRNRAAHFLWYSSDFTVLRTLNLYAHTSSADRLRRPSLPDIGSSSSC